VVQVAPDLTAAKAGSERVEAMNTKPISGARNFFSMAQIVLWGLAQMEDLDSQSYLPKWLIASGIPLICPWLSLILEMSQERINLQNGSKGMV